MALSSAGAPRSCARRSPALLFWVRGRHRRARTHVRTHNGRSLCTSADADRVTLFICGDVMTGRGVDQILSHPSGPQSAGLLPFRNVPHDRWLGAPWRITDLSSKRVPGGTVWRGGRNQTRQEHR